MHGNAQWIPAAIPPEWRRTTDGEGGLAVPIVHPLRCLQSVFAHGVTLHRRHDIACRLLVAAPIVLREHRAEMLVKGVKGTMKHSSGSLGSLGRL